MFRSTRCCGCMSLLKGCYLIALITFIYSVLTIKFVLIFHSEPKIRNQKSAENNSFLCLVVPELILFIPSSAIILYGLFRKKCLAFIYAFIVSTHIVYFIVMFAITAVGGTNIIVNEAGLYIHLFWVFCLLRFGKF
ncbi:uncharacterized protein LOC111604404 [Drosophila hydei]|uniref:Uncharacterized protein LOC111604404 n=1 Tax=Drosophila hydei TaxID=7224 RepID=A0A6J1MA21_DROHY|nr:uncharacterized protein LOC111604404 [Drosophila hydei]